MPGPSKAVEAGQHQRLRQPLQARAPPRLKRSLSTSVGCTGK